MTSDEAAHKVAQLMLVMRIEIRKKAFTLGGSIEDARWSEVYDAVREYEDAQVRDMLAESERTYRRKRRIRRDERKAKSVPTETRRKPKEGHPWRSSIEPSDKRRT